MGQRGAARAIGVVGRGLVGSGLVVLLFAAYQLWGTGLSESKSQDRLSDAFEARMADALVALATTSSVPAGGTGTLTGAPVEDGSVAPTPTVPPELIDLVYPAEGEPLARIVIPRIGVDKVVVEGTAEGDLRKGPGHFGDSSLPGQKGNTAIAGHRTTYGAPFGDIDQLQPGDEIHLTTVLGQSTYRVAGTEIVSPDQTEVVGDFGDNRLTLTACHPKFSASQRIVVWALLEGDPVPTVARPEDRVTIDLSTTPTAAPVATTFPTTPTTPTSAGERATTTTPTSTSATTPTATTAGVLDAAGDAGDTAPETNGLAGDRTAWPGAVLWALATLAAGTAAWGVALILERRRGTTSATRRWLVYALASPAVGACLVLCFSYVDRLLPSY